MAISINLAGLYQEPSAHGELGHSQGQLTASLWLPAFGSATLIVAVGLWVSALARTDVGGMAGYGLLSVLPWEFYAALVAIVVGFAVLVRRGALPSLLTGHIVALVFFLHATPAILYGTLRYSWAWKHIGVMDFIQRHGTVDTASPFLNPFQNWPGFFAWGAFVGDLAGGVDIFLLASWAPVYFNLLNLAAIAFIVRAFTRDNRLFWLALWFFLLANWVGQDYFAPQAVSFFLYLVVLGIVLNRFGRRVMERPSAVPRRVRGGAGEGVALLREPTTAPDPSSGDFGGPQGSRKANAGLLTVVFLLFAALAYTHQLTPIVGVFALAFLAVFKRLTALTLPILLAVVTLTWMLYGAAYFVSENLAWVLEWMGRIGATLESNLLDVSVVSREQVVVSIFSRGLSGLVIVLAGIGALRRIRNGYWDVAALLPVLGAWALLPISSYGGELLFRLYLFSVPFIAYLVAGMVFPSPTSGRSWLTAVATAALSLVLLTGYLFAYYGKDHQYYFTPEEVAAAEYVYTNGSPGSLLVEGSPNYPAQFRNYEHFTYVPIAWEPEETRNAVLEDPVGVLSDWVASDEYTAVYIIITRSQKMENEMSRDMPLDALDRIEAALEASPLFHAAFSNEHASVFVPAPGEQAE